MAGALRARTHFFATRSRWQAELPRYRQLVDALILHFSLHFNSAAKTGPTSSPRQRVNPYRPCKLASLASESSRTTLGYKLEALASESPYKLAAQPLNPPTSQNRIRAYLTYVSGSASGSVDALAIFTNSSTQGGQQN